MRPQAPGAAVCLASMLAAGCLTGAQTFEQDLGYQRWKWCDTFATVKLQRIDADGRVVVTGSEADREGFLRCMAAQAREQQRAKHNLVVPDPVFNPLP